MIELRREEPHYSFHDLLAGSFAKMFEIRIRLNSNDAGASRRGSESKLHEV
jgi:hypothetical protein